ncbi:MAG: phosphoribosylanthranilate isomerase [Pseudomonadota bacterium]
MSAIVKICGVRTPDDITVAAGAGASHVGFVFYPKSPRYIEVDKAVAAISDSGAAVKKVALVVAPDEALIDIIADSGAFDAVQFHGNETPDALARFKARLTGKIEIWRAVGMASPQDVAGVQRFVDVADMLLFDAKPPDGASRPGGLGAAFDWSFLAGYDGAAPWLLAGGLTPQTVSAAVARVKALTGFRGVDVSSGVERSAGVKDKALVAQFCAEACAALGMAAGKDGVSCRNR